jgi:hypothetical protein
MKAFARLAVVAVGVVAVIGVANQAQAGGFVSWGGGGAVVIQQPVVVPQVVYTTSPVYTVPQQVYYSSVPAYTYQPQVVYAQPPVVYAQPPVVYSYPTYPTVVYGSYYRPYHHRGLSFGFSW